MGLEKGYLEEATSKVITKEEPGEEVARQAFQATRQHLQRPKWEACECAVYWGELERGLCS